MVLSHLHPFSLLHPIFNHSYLLPAFSSWHIPNPLLSLRLLPFTLILLNQPDAVIILSLVLLATEVHEDLTQGGICFILPQLLSMIASRVLFFQFQPVFLKIKFHPQKLIATTPMHYGQKPHHIKSQYFKQYMLNYML